MTPAAAPAASHDRELTEIVLGRLREVGLVAVGVAAAERFTETRADLYARREAGLHGGMAFTYRNPDRSTDPQRILDGARSLVVGAYDYLRESRGGDSTSVAGGRVARYAQGNAYAELSAALCAGAATLTAAGHRALVVADQNSLVDREAARRAGLGGYGHNANLLLPGWGSWCILGSIVTDAALEPSTPVGAGCGTCTRCIDGCPTGAIVGLGVVDARRCLSWLLQAPGVFPWEWRVTLGNRMYGCDDCQEVCPPNLLRARRSPPPAATEEARELVDVAMFLQDDDAAVLAAAGRWYVFDRNPRYLRRNALIVLGNSADPGDHRAIGLVQDALGHADPLVRAHAVWAAARLGRPELADGLLSTEADPMVCEELTLREKVPSRA